MKNQKYVTIELFDERTKWIVNELKAFTQDIANAQKLTADEVKCVAKRVAILEKWQARVIGAVTILGVCVTAAISYFKK